MLFVSPVMPAEHGNGLAMRVGFFLQAYAELFDIDLAVFPIVTSPARSPEFARRYAAQMTVFPHPGVDAHFGLVDAINDPRERLTAFRLFGRPSIAAFSTESARQALSEPGGGFAWRPVLVGAGWTVAHLAGGLLLTGLLLYLASMVWGAAALDSSVSSSPSANTSSPGTLPSLVPPLISTMAVTATRMAGSAGTAAALARGTGSMRSYPSARTLTSMFEKTI